MKKNGSLLLFLLCWSINLSFGRNTTLTVKLNVHSKDSLYVGKLDLSFFRTVKGVSRSGLIQFNNKGFGKRIFEHETRIEIQQEYFGYIVIDTVINTGTLDKIDLVFELYPRFIPYSDSLALEDIRNNQAKLIIFDKRLYAADQRFHFGRAFGFEYLCFKNPYGFIQHKDNFAIQHYESYNNRIIQFMDKQYPEHRNLLLAIADSLLNYNADSIGKHSPIDAGLIKFDVVDALPSEFRSTVTSQIRDNHWDSVRQNSDPAFISPLKVMSVDQVINSIKLDEDIFCLTDIDRMVVYNYAQVIPLLVDLLLDTAYVGEKNIGKNVRERRIGKDIVKSYFKPNFTGKENVAIVAGRANYLLKQLTGEINFGVVNMSSSHADLNKIRNRWAYYFTHLKEWTNAEGI